MDQTHSNCHKIYEYDDLLGIINNGKSNRECMFGNNGEEEYQLAMNSAISRVLEYYSGTRAYIFKFDWDKRTCSNIFECCREGVKSQLDLLQDIPNEVTNIWIGNFEEHECVYIPSVEALKEARFKEYQILKSQNIKSLLACAFYVDSRLYGFVGVDDPVVNTNHTPFIRTTSYFISNEISKHQLQEELIRQSYMDRLTGIYNRNRFYLYLEEFERNVPKNAGIIFIDLNGLKKINDTYGHDYGDTVIRGVSQKIQEAFPDDMKFRMSGDEFLVVIENILYHTFLEKAEAIRKSLLQDGQMIAACGFVWEKSPHHLKTLVKKADQLMYANKQCYYKNHAENYIHKPCLLAEILESIRNREFLLYLQPKCDIKNLTVFGAEALIRRVDKNNNIEAPGKFAPLFEREHLISHIDFYMLEEVCRLVHKWKQKKYRSIIISINFSKITLMEDNFVPELVDCCKRHKVEPHEIELEITETSQIIDKNKLIKVLLEVKQLGFQVALDDFGTEYSSIDMLSSHDLDIMKIDLTLIRNMVLSRKNKIIVEHVIRIAHELGMKCVAEGVETIEQLQMLREMKCEYIQGYLISKPISVEQFEKAYIGTNKSSAV